MTSALATRWFAAGVAVGALLLGCAPGAGDAGLVNGTSSSSTGGASSTSGGVAGTSTTGTSGTSSGGSSGGGTVGGGTSSGLSTAGAFTPNTEISLEVTVFEGYPRSGLVVLLADLTPRPANCGDLSDGGGPFGGTEVVVEFLQLTPPYVVGEGRYVVVPPGAVSTAFGFDAGVAVVFEGTAGADGGFDFLATSTSGEVDLAQVDVGSTTIGSFTADMVEGLDGGALGTLSGSFDAMWCGPTD